LEVPEVVINIVSYEMVQQTSLASCEYPKGTDEFVKAGFTKEPATVVRPPRFNITLIWRIPFSYPCASGF
jgi:flavin reductase (DIM6/NTAB) family NADH-FMN oxidoreductase RutF